MVRLEENAAARAAALLACDESLKSLSYTDKKRVVELLQLSLFTGAHTRNYVKLPPVRRFR